MTISNNIQFTDLKIQKCANDSIQSHILSHPVELYCQLIDNLSSDGRIGVFDAMFAFENEN